MLPSPLIRYTLRGLDRCFMPEAGLWSFKYHLDGRSRPNESRLAYDVFYSLNVLVGLSRVRDAARAAIGTDPGLLLESVAAKLEGSGARHCAYGTALWAAAELAVPAPRLALDGARQRTSDAATLRSYRAQDLGMLLSGVSGQARTDPSWSEPARRIRDAILPGLSTPTGLFRDRASGPRRVLATFATQVYCVLGLYHYAAVFDDPEAAAAADACVARLLTLQGPQGEWPWFYNVATGRVVDYYEVYSVHQHGMAPAILKPAIGRGVPGAREALSKGFDWIFGANQLSTSMLRPDLGVVARSQARRDFGDGRIARIARTAFDFVTGQAARIDVPPERLMIRPEVRSYELGWILWSFGNDADFRHLTHHEAFGSPDRDGSSAAEADPDTEEFDAISSRRPNRVSAAGRP